MEKVLERKLIDAFEEEYVKYFVFNYDLKYALKTTNILEISFFFEKLSNFILSLEESIDSCDIDNIYRLLSVFREKAIKDKDEERINECNKLILKTNKIKCDEDNSYVRKVFSKTSIRNKSLNNNLEVQDFKKIFLMNVNLICMLLASTETEAIEYINYLSANEYFFYSLNFIFDRVPEVLNDNECLSSFLAVTMLNKKVTINGKPLFIKEPRLAQENKKTSKMLIKQIKSNS